MKKFMLLSSLIAFSVSVVTASQKNISKNDLNKHFAGLSGRVAIKEARERGLVTPTKKFRVKTEALAKATKVKGQKLSW